MKTHQLKSILFFAVLCFLWFQPVVADELSPNSSIADPQAITLTVTNIRYNSFTLSWTAHPDATKYKLWVKRETSGGWETYTAYNGKEFGMTVLKADIVNVESSWNRTRQVVLQAIKNTTVVEEATKTFDILGKPWPFDLKYTPGSTTISVEWPAYDDDYSYIVYAYKNVGGSLTNLPGYPHGYEFSQDHKPYTLNITGLDLGTKYEFTVKAKSYGNWHDTLHQVQYTSPAVPQVMAATSIKPNSFVANWKTTPVAPQYKLYVKESATGKYVLRGLTIDGKLNYSMENLEPGTNYEYQVSSVNPVGESELSSVAKVFTTNLPVPVAISPNSVASTYFEARWNTLTNATGYLLQVSDGEVWTNYTISSGTTKSYLLTGMKPDFTYEYRVRAYFGKDYTRYSNVITLKTQNAPVARAVSLQEDPTKATLVWDPVAGATGYRLYVISNEGAANNPAGYFPKVLGTGLNHHMTGLKTGHSYQFYLDAIIPSGYTTISNKFDFFTAPAVPVCLDPTEITATSFKARWQVFDDVDETYLSVFHKSNGIPVTGFNNKLVSNDSETVTGLVYQTEYFFIVKVKKNGLFSFPSAYMYVKTDYVQLNLSATPASGGTVTGDGWKKLHSQVIATASPAKGYEFVNWTKGTTPVSTSQSYTFNITTNTSLTANFKATTANYTVNLSASPATGGTASGGGSFANGSSVTVTASPSKGYEFVNWTEGGKEVSKSASYVFTISANRTLVANFKQAVVNYTVAVSAEPTLAGSVSGGGTYASGTSVTTKATANKGYEFVNWTEGGKEVSKSASYVFTISANRTLVANFKSTTPVYKITLEANPVDGGTFAGGGNYEKGTTVNISASPKSGYDFVGWFVGEKFVSSSVNEVFIATANVTYTAKFKLKGWLTLSLAADPSTGGTIAGAGGFEPGSSVTIKATPETGYEFVNWIRVGSGVEVSKSATYTFTITESIALTAKFKATTTSYIISLLANPAAGGVVSGGGQYIDGKTITVSATAKKGYEFVNWIEGDKVVSTAEDYTFTITAARTLKANFSQQVQNATVTLAANPVAGGNVSGGGTFTLGTSVTAIATANSGYEFVNWTENGSQVSTSAIYTFTISANRELAANFKQQTQNVTLTLSASPAAGGTVNGGGTFNVGSSVTVSATPASNYDFVQWTEGTSVISTNPDYTFNIAGNKTLTAVFTLKTPVVEIKSDDLKVYPNPVTDVLNLEGINEKTTIRIFNVTGNLVEIATVNENGAFDVSFLNSGIYFFVFGNSTIKATRKIIKN